MESFQAIAERSLRYSKTGEDVRRELVIRVGAPQLLTTGNANFPFEPGAAYCDVEFDGIDLRAIRLHGVDSIHAIAQATDIDTLLREVSGRYAFYWPSGEPYFDQRGQPSRVDGEQENPQRKTNAPCGALVTYRALY